MSISTNYQYRTKNESGAERHQTENPTQKGSFLSRAFSVAKSGAQAFGQLSLTNKVAAVAYLGNALVPTALESVGVKAPFTYIGFHASLAITGTVACIANMIRGNETAANLHVCVPAFIFQGYAMAVMVWGLGPQRNHT